MLLTSFSSHGVVVRPMVPDLSTGTCESFFNENLVGKNACFPPGRLGLLCFNESSVETEDPTSSLEDPTHSVSTRIG